MGIKMATNKKRPNVFPNFPRKKKNSTQENSAQEMENSAQEMENSAQETKEKKKPNFFPNFPKKNSARVKQRKLMEESVWAQIESREEIGNICQKSTQSLGSKLDQQYNG